MNQGVEILIKRMESHPEEFALDLNQEWHGTEGKWQHITRCIYSRASQLNATTEAVPTSPFPALPFLTDAEILALHAKLMSIQAEAFTQMIVQNIMQKKEVEEEEADTPMSSRYKLTRLKREGKKVEYDHHNPGMKYRK